MADFNAIKKKADEEAKVKIEQSNKIYDDQYAATEKIYNDQIKQSDASYSRAYDRANVRRIVNERYAKEMAANMGLSNSGYNLTQQTQIMLSYGNAVLETDMQKNAAANSIRQQLAGVKADIEAQKSQSAFNIQDAYDRQAVDTYNQQVADENAAARAEVEAAAKIEAARVSAQESAVKQQQSDYNALKKILVNSNYSDKQKALEINSYCSAYGTDPSEFLNYIGMSDSSYFNHLGIISSVGPQDSLSFQSSLPGGGMYPSYGVPDELKYGYTMDYGTLIPGRNGISVLYKDGTTRLATDDEKTNLLKPKDLWGKGLMPKKIVNKPTTK